MAIRNGYITLADLKNYITSQGMQTDTTDDTVMERLIEAASRAFDDVTHRRFYPRIETLLFDTPDSLELWVDDDLLRVLSLTNGDSTAIGASSYTLRPLNSYPKYTLTLKGSSGIVFLLDANGDADGAISLVCETGYHPLYDTDAWRNTTTLNGAISSTSATSVTFASNTDLAAGQIVKIDNEFMLITTVATNSTVVRGWNGSTAATHSNGATVYVWGVYEPVAQAIREIAHNEYQKRTGQTGEGAASVTAAGVVIRPAGFPQTAMDIADSLRRVV